jgi:hypothetical protein
MGRLSGMSTGSMTMVGQVRLGKLDEFFSFLTTGKGRRWNVQGRQTIPGVAFGA